MAIYECFDSYAAFENYTADSGPDFEPAVRMLVAEYFRQALDRAWFYYPDALPSDVLADKQRNGHIDRKLSFPLEDLYPDGQPAGQVGQEIYGCGAAFIFATRSHMNVEGAPFRIFCDHFMRWSDRGGDRILSIQLDGGATCLATGMPLPHLQSAPFANWCSRFDSARPGTAIWPVLSRYWPLCAGVQSPSR